jgi:hypothetical protein
MTNLLLIRVHSSVFFWRSENWRRVTDVSDYCWLNLRLLPSRAFYTSVRNFVIGVIQVHMCR